MVGRLGSGSIPAAIALVCLGAIGCATEHPPPDPEGARRPPSAAMVDPAAAEAPDPPLALAEPRVEDASASPVANAVEPPVADSAAAAPSEEPPSSEPEAEGAARGDDLLDDSGSYEPPPAPRDPLEPMNRAFFSFNQHLDRWFWQPLTDGYRFITPEPLRRGVRRALHNLNSPVFFVNDLLQLRFTDAAETFGSFALNSTLGILGFFEPAHEAGWRAREADFGQTLALVGIGAGPYVVVPILGPTTIRDGLGSAVDRFFQPLTYVLGFGTQILWGGGEGLSTREEFSDQLAELERSSVDFYSAMRSVYLQNREAEVEVARQRRAANLHFRIPDDQGPTDLKTATE